MAQWPSLTDVRTLLRLQPDATEDGVISDALAAAVDYGNRRLAGKYPIPPDDDGTLPEVCRQACLLDAARIYRRRDSIDGTISWGDMGAVRVGRADPDVDRLYAAAASMVFG